MNLQAMLAKRLLSFAVSACIFSSMFMLSPSAVFAAISFPDVTPETWCYTSVMDMSNNGLLSGYPDGTFKQERTISRAESATILATLSLPSLLSDKTFSDVDSTHWFYNSLYAAITSGVVEPLTTGAMYQPDKPLTRGEAAIIASRLYGLQSAYNTVNLSTYSDGGSISSAIGKKSWQNMISTGVISGYPDGSLKPDGTITRGEFCQMFSFINHITREQLAHNLRTSLLNDDILKANTVFTVTPENQTYEIVLSDLSGSLTSGKISSATMNFTTDNIPDGAKIELVSSDPGYVTVPATATVKSGSGSFKVENKSSAIARDYVITASYAGSSFTKTITVKSATGSHIGNISVGNSLVSGKSGSTQVTVTTKDVPNDSILDVTIDGSGLSISNTSEKVRSNKVVYTITSTNSTPGGTYRFTAGYNGDEKTVDIRVTGSNNTNNNNNQHYYEDTTVSSNNYITRFTVSDYLEYGYADSVIVTLDTNGLSDGTILYPEVTGDLTVSGTCVVYNDKASFTVNSRSSTPSGTYTINVYYSGYTAKGQVIVNSNGNNNHVNGYLQSMSVNGSLKANEFSSAIVTVYTRDLSDGTILFPYLPSGLSMSGGCIVYNNQAVFTVYGHENVSVGNHTISVSYEGRSVSAVVKVEDGGQLVNLKSISYANGLTHGVASSSVITVLTQNISNGKMLTIAVAPGLTVASNTCVVNSNKATFTVTSDVSTPVGNYAVDVSYGNDTTSVNVPVVATVANPYILGVIVDKTLVAGTVGMATITINTTGIVSGTVLQPSVQGTGISVTQPCTVYNNKAVFGVLISESTPVGSYIVTIPYGGHIATTNVVVTAS